jgi:methyl-accepting chemotaxis protein
MKLSQKLLVAPVVTAVVLFALSFASNRTLQASRQAADQQVAVVIGSMGVFTGTQDQLGKLHASAYRTVSLSASLDDAKFKAVKTDIEQQTRAIAKAISQAAEAVGNDETILKEVAETEKLLAAYSKQTLKALDLAAGDPNTGAVEMQDADATFGSVGKSLGAIVARLDSVLSESTQASRLRAESLSNALAAAGLLLAVGAVLFSIWIQRQVVGDLQRAVAVTNAVAGGNLQVNTNTSSNDEVGDLIRALERMCNQLSDSMSEVMLSSDSIRTSSAEIASGTMDLSSRTEQTASSLSQATSSVEQLTGAVRQSADSARTANNLAASAAQVASRGGTQIRQVVETMDEINTSSRKIGDIIAVIDGIAFQTNILALNAAVEAARAGEQGRGFAVVASEVRSLAGRSAEAAREIKTLIHASMEKVEGGSRLVAESGETMTEIVRSVQSVTDMISGIASAADSQSEEIGHVNKSVTQLDQMTQQNAALVEQSSAAAESLKDQAGKLVQIVSTFKLRETHGTGSTLRLT